jgi:hypothetical protein
MISGETSSLNWAAGGWRRYSRASTQTATMPSSGRDIGIVLLPIATIRCMRGLPPCSSPCGPSAISGEIALQTLRVRLVFMLMWLTGWPPIRRPTEPSASSWDS